jgi:hypothetical protein
MTNKNLVRIFYFFYAVTITLLLAAPAHIFPDFYQPYFMAGTAAISVVTVAIFGRYFRSDDVKKNNVVEYCQAYLAISLGLNGLGGLGFYKLYRFGIPYDKIMHFIVPAILMVCGVYLLVHRFGKSKKYAAIFMIASIFIGSLVWEGVEVGQDRIFGTKTAGVYGEDYTKDTILDIVAAVAGIGVGGYFLSRSKKLNESIERF